MRDGEMMAGWEIRGLPLDFGDVIVVGIRDAESGVIVSAERNATMIAGTQFLKSLGVT